jgi:hypothetical protein
MKLPEWGEIADIPFETRNDLEKFVYEFEPADDKDTIAFTNWLQRAVDFIVDSAKMDTVVCPTQEARLLGALDAKNVKIGRLDDDVMRLTKAVESRDAKIKELTAAAKAGRGREI